MFCIRCGTRLDDGASFCSHCGAQVAPAVGPVAAPEPDGPAGGPALAPGPDGPVGGPAVSPGQSGPYPWPAAAPWPLSPPEVVSPKSRLAATLLACPWLVVGLFGAHRFYMGKIKTAVGMLLLGISPIICIGGIFAAVAIYPEAEDPPLLFFVFLILMYVLSFAASIWALVDFIIAVSGNFKDNEGRPIKKW